MTKEKLIIHDNVLLAKLILGDSWNQGLSFYSDEKDFIQVGTWKYNSGKELLAHKHNIVPRNSRKDVLCSLHVLDSWIFQGDLQAAFIRTRLSVISYRPVLSPDTRTCFDSQMLPFCRALDPIRVGISLALG